MKVFYTQPEQGPSQKTEFNIYKWFMVENTDVCNATCDPHKQRIFRSLTGQLYLNIFPGFLHVLRPISTFESTIHLAVKFISHIQDIWCSGDWNLTEYIIKWLAGVSAGRKMYSILYLKSGQGWGKGIITDFIQRSVLGTQLVYKTSDPQTILGSFNGQLQEEKPEPVEEKPAPVIRKTPPPLPPKPDHLKEHSDSTTANPVPEKPSAPEPDNYDVLDDLLSDSDFTTVNSAAEQQPEYPAESSASVTKLTQNRLLKSNLSRTRTQNQKLTGILNQRKALERTGLGKKDTDGIANHG
ncbi:hypothetical protein GLOIN_2v1880406 [Rhizophagus irregularis DAOM 181602=DAOM 197198]|nr:hypothetical protein GLOIN_2v1880406 [Rhizophagus irregularis DAOM 181602=DAOM 197198]